MFDGHLPSKILELVLVYLDWSSGTSVLEVEIPIFELSKPILSSSLSYVVPSVHRTNISASLARLLTSIESEKKEVSEMRFLLT